MSAPDTDPFYDALRNRLHDYEEPLPAGGWADIAPQLALTPPPAPATWWQRAPRRRLAALVLLLLVSTAALLWWRQSAAPARVARSGPATPARLATPPAAASAPVAAPAQKSAVAAAPGAALADQPAAPAANTRMAASPAGARPNGFGGASPRPARPRRSTSGLAGRLPADSRADSASASANSRAGVRAGASASRRRRTPYAAWAARRPALRPSQGLSARAARESEASRLRPRTGQLTGRSAAAATGQVGVPGHSMKTGPASAATTAAPSAAGAGKGATAVASKTLPSSAATTAATATLAPDGRLANPSAPRPGAVGRPAVPGGDITSSKGRPSAGAASAESGPGAVPAVPVGKAPDPATAASAPAVSSAAPGAAAASAASSASTAAGTATETAPGASNAGVLVGAVAAKTGGDKFSGKPVPAARPAGTTDRAKFNGKAPLSAAGRRAAVATRPQRRTRAAAVAAVRREGKRPTRPAASGVGRGQNAPRRTEMVAGTRAGVPGAEVVASAPPSARVAQADGEPRSGPVSSVAAPAAPGLPNDLPPPPGPRDTLRKRPARLSLGLLLGVAPARRGAGSVPSALNRAEAPGLGASAEVAARYVLTPNLALRTGLGYAQQRQQLQLTVERRQRYWVSTTQVIVRPNPGGPPDTLRVQSYTLSDSLVSRDSRRFALTQRYFTLPLAAEWRPRIPFRWQPVLSLGATAHWLLRGSYLSTTAADPCQCQEQTQRGRQPGPFAPVGVALAAGLGLDYALSPRATLLLRPSAAYWLRPTSRTGAAPPLSANLQLGLLFDTRRLR